MISSAQQIANQQNALLSTGSQTPEGKLASCYNAQKHAILRQTLSPYEEELY